MIIIDAFELLKKLHNYGIVSRESGKTLKQLRDMFELSEDEVRNVISDLVNYKYIVKIEGDGVALYHLSSQGIIAVCSIFT